jgi:membrane protein
MVMLAHLDFWHCNANNLPMGAWFWDLLDRFFFGSPTGEDGERPAIVRILAYPYAVIRDIRRGQITLRAMGLVFYSLLSLIPLLALSFVMLKGFGAHHNLRPILEQFFSPLGASASRITEEVMHFADRVRSGLVGGVGIALLLWTLIGTIKKIEDSFNFLWRVQHARSLGRRLLEYLGLIVVAPILLVAFMALTRSALQSTPVQLAAATPLMGRLLHLGIQVAPYVIATGLFALIYLITPNTRVRLVPALTGATAAGLLWAAAGILFTTFVVYSTRLAVVYAGFAVVVTAFMWTYFGWLILLGGALLAFYVQNPKYLRQGLTEIILSAVEAEQLSLKIMYLVACGDATGEKRWTADDLAAELGLPGTIVAHMTIGLEQGGLLRMERGDALVPARGCAHISLNQILDVARRQTKGYSLPSGLRIGPIERLLGKIEQARRTTCANRTLQDLVSESNSAQADPAATVPQSSGHR